MANKEKLWCPDVCSITGRPFFMWLEHPSKGYVPTYGGPFDSYTMAEPDDDGTFVCERYDHDAGHWCDWSDGISLRLIDDQREDYECGTVDALRARIAELNQTANDLADGIVRQRKRIAELEARQVPEGWQVVPKEPTDEMFFDPDDVCVNMNQTPWDSFVKIYQRMLTAAPSPADSGEVKP